MEISEYQAYAAAAWHRFDQEVTDTLLRAVAGSFALIACADGDLAKSEVDGFVQTVIAQDMLPKVPPEQLEHAFRQLCEAMFTDVEAGRSHAREAVLAVKGDSQQAELVVQAAELAMRADGRVRDTEQDALEALCKELGVDLRELHARQG